jgi:predicted membrane protein
VRVLRLLKIPGMAIGFVAGLLVGGLAAAAGAPTSYIIVSALGLGIPLAISGAIYDALLDAGRIPFGRIAPVALYGILTFPIARLIQELLLTGIFGQGITLQQEANVLQFLVYQGIMGFGYGIGFLMIHSQIIEVSAWRAYRKQAKEEGGNKQPRAAEKRA